MSRILTNIFARKTITTYLINTNTNTKTKTITQFDVENYEYELSQKQALQLGYDEFELSNRIDNIDKYRNNFDSEKIALNPYCCGVCGNCSY